MSLTACRGCLKVLNMQEALKVIEAMVELVYQEVNRATNDRMMNDKSYALLKEAAVDAINLKNKIQEARGWNIK